MASLTVENTRTEKHQLTTREELNREVIALLARARRTVGKRHASVDIVTTELRRDCQLLRAELQQLKHKCAELSPPPAESHGEVLSCTADLQLEEMRLQAELAVFQSQNIAEGVSTQDAVLQSTAYQQVCESNSQLNQLLLALRTERERVKTEKESEQTLLKESKELVEALEKKVVVLQSRTGGKTSDSVEAELRERISLVDDSINSLRENLVRFCMEEIMHPSDGPGREKGKKKKRKGEQERVDNLLLRRSVEEEREQFPTLPDLVQELISKTLSSPHSPYLPLSSVWSPHGTLLVRSGVIQRHPDNPTLVRIAPFHL